MTRLAFVLVLALGACDGGPECIVIPGPDVEPGFYALDSFWIWPDTASAEGLPYADAEEMTIELSSDRSLAIIRYVRDGTEVEERWSVEIHP